MALKPNAQAIKQGYVDACNAVLTRGGSVTSGAPIGDLSKSILAIPHDQTLTYHTGVGTKMQVTVPQSVEKYALVDKVGGMTYKIRNPDNLFPKYIDDKIPKNAGETLTTDGVSVTLNADGSITLNGTVNWFFLQFSEGSFYNPDGYHTFSFGTKLPEGTVLAYDILNFTDEETGEEWWDTQRNDISSGETTISVPEFSFLTLEFTQGAVFNNLTLYPTYVKSQEAIPYFKIQDTKVTELVSEGANLIPYPFPYKEPTTTRAGITFTDNGDGSITLNGKNDGTNHSTFRISNRPSNVLHIKAGTYKGSTGVDGVILQLYNGKKYYSPGEGFTLDTDGDFQLYVQVSRNTAKVFENTVIYPMLNYGTVAQPYKPYVGKLDTLTMPEYVRNIDGYGDGVNEEYYNYVDFKRKVLVIRSNRIVLNGTETWAALGTNKNGIYRNGVFVTPNPIPTDNYSISPIVCNLYKNVTPADTYYHIRGCSCNSQVIHFYNEEYNTSDISLWKAHVADLYAKGTPIVVVYALAEPIEVDISAYLTDEGIIVEGGGTITAVNEYSQDLPTEITYLINTTGGG